MEERGWGTSETQNLTPLQGGRGHLERKMPWLRVQMQLDLNDFLSEVISPLCDSFPNCLMGQTIPYIHGELATHPELHDQPHSH